MKKEILMKELLTNIDFKRNEMIKIAEVVGFASEKTIKCSQELDMFLIEYQMISLKMTS